MLRWKDTRRLRVLEPRRAEEIALDRARSGAPIFPDATERQSAPTELTVAGGSRVRILPAPAASPSLQVNFTAAGEKCRFLPSGCMDWDRRTGRDDGDPALIGAFSLSAVDAVPLRESTALLQRHTGPDLSRGRRHLWFGLACEQSALLAPVER